LRAMTDFDIAEDLGAGPDQHAIANLGVAVTAGLAGSAERDAMQDRDVVLDHRRLADDETGGVVEEDALADARRRVDVGWEHGGGPALQVKREILAAVIPEPMRPAVCLDGVKTLEVENRQDEAVAGRVAVVIGLDVDAHGRRPGRIVVYHDLEGLA